MSPPSIPDTSMPSTTVPTSNDNNNISTSATAVTSSSSSSGAASSSSYDDLDNKNVGILAMQVYTPRTFVKQEALEKHVGVAAGKFTIGLGQEGLAVTGDAEDINSVCLTVVQSLLETYNIDPAEVGRLEVGTETVVDKSKSTKTVLMDLFKDSGNTDVEGATVINACYGGTAALLNAFLWCASDEACRDKTTSRNDGQVPRYRYAIVVAADIATYARGPARPTSGAGAVAMLVGRDAPLACTGPRATHAAHVWDFFKPDHTTEYPSVDGALSQVCYYQALEDVYQRFCDQMDATQKKSQEQQPFDATQPDYFCFHAPYNKLVQKSYARLFLMDARRRYARLQQKEKLNDVNNSNPDENNDLTNMDDHPLKDWLTKPIKDTYSDKTLEKTLKAVSSESYKQRLQDSNAASKLVGNTYTASVHLGLASLVDRRELKAGQNVVLFSYGSGALATIYRLQVRVPTSSQHKHFTVANMAAAMKLSDRLAAREEVNPFELDHALETRARMHRAGAPYSPVYPPDRLFPGTYYLHGVDAKWRRTYIRVPLDAPLAPLPQAREDGSLDYLPLAPPIVLRLARQDAVSHPVTGRLQVLTSATEGNADQHTEVRRRIACVITGTAAGLPRGRGGRGEPVFCKENFDRLLRGEQCIQPITEEVKKAMLEKNVVQLIKLPDKTVKRVPVDTEEKCVKLAAQLGNLDLPAAYGVPPGLAQTMDVAAQLAVAAGLEALKDAGLVAGISTNPQDWQLPERYRDSTGVVYASSFPAMDAAVGEVMRFLECQTVGAASTMRLIAALRDRVVRSTEDGELMDEDEAAFARLISRTGAASQGEESGSTYEFDRKFLFRVLVLGNAQLAQLAGCRGPNTQTNAACAGTTQAIAMAQDMLISGRAERVVVVAGDNASGDVLLPWLGSGFRALGAACTKGAVEDASMPFDKRRSGMLIGAGGIGMVLETEMSMTDRQKLTPDKFQVKARLLATQYSNSAYHGAALDRKHIGSELDRFLKEIELVHGICRAEIASHGVYFSHETSTHASDASSCSGNEVAALRHAFGDELLAKLLILNTKGFTGHPMGVSFEDVTAVEVLMQQRVPPVPNYQEKDDYLGDLNISKGGPYACRYALRFAAGFGSQVAFALYSSASSDA